MDFWIKIVIPTLFLHLVTGVGSTTTPATNVSSGFPYKTLLEDYDRMQYAESMQTSYEYQIKKHLLKGYDITTRPVKNDSDTVDVTIAMSLFHILDTNEKQQTVSALFSLRLRWTDQYMTWNPDDFGGVQTIWIPAKEIWIPDILIKNNADEKFTEFMRTNVIIESSGKVLWMVPTVTKTTCKLNVLYFPFDEQQCEIVFFSWTYNGYNLNVSSNDADNNTVYYTPDNQEWWADEISVERHEKIYACCKEPYPDVTFTLHLRRRSLFYIFNLIYPCLLIYLVSFLGFFLPVESGEKVNLEITILLALVVFLLVVSETLPPTPDRIPILGMLYGTTMLMVSVALVMAVIVTNIYFKKDTHNRVPKCIRRFLVVTCKAGNKYKKSKCSSKQKYKKQDSRNGGRNQGRFDNIELEIISQSQTATTLDTNDEVYLDEEDNYPDRYHSLTLSRSFSNESIASKQNTDEWLQLANVIDKIFFWIFLVASVIALSTMFGQIPSLRLG